MTYKLAVVVGHTSRAPGAVGSGPLRGVSEYQFNSQIAGAMSRLGADYDLEIGVFMRHAALGYGKQIEKAYGEADAWGADLTLELHFNSAASRAARYTVTLSSGTDRSLRFARRAQAAMVRCLGRSAKQDAGVVTRARHERGGFSLIAGKAPAILVEPFFGSSAADCKLMKDTGAMAYARCLLAAAADMAATLPRGTLKKSRTMWGQAMNGAGLVSAGAGEGSRQLAGTLSEAGTAIQMVAGASVWLTAAGTCLLLGGIGVTLWARVDDFNKARR